MTQNTILIVDDEPANLLLLETVLRPWYRVLAANSGERALRGARRAEKPDLILLDVMMPDLDGFEVLTRLREDETTRDIPVIFVTAMGEEADEQHGLSLGAVDYISKPIRAAIVLARVRAHLELKKARDLLQNQNRGLEAEVARRLRDNLLIQDVALCSLAEMVESRDRETGNHIRRTQAYVEILGSRLQRSPRFRESLGGRDLDRIVKAAPLHDLGKIGIPDQILLKPGPLTSEEFEVMKRHCRIGSEAIRRAMQRGAALYPEHVPLEGEDALAFLEIASVIAASHHERWDGRGYPDGLSGFSIPLPARLMAVADVFDALTTQRIYKTPVGPEVAFSEMRADRGGHFDPDVCDAFDAAEGDFIQVYRRFADLGDVPV